MSSRSSSRRSTRWSAEGVKYIQIDAPRYSYYLDPKWREHIRHEMGVDPEARARRGHPRGQRLPGGTRGARASSLAIHLCRGNNRSQWYAEGGYDPIAEKLFNELDVDVFLLEYESERAGTFEPLRFVPPTRASSWVWSAARFPELEPEDAARAGASTKRAATCRSRTWRSARSAASRPRSKATC